MTPIEARLQPRTAVVVGANGGIGGALLKGLAANDDVGLIFAASRDSVEPVSDKVVPVRVDATDEASIARLARQLDGRHLDLVIVAVGLLHSESIQPEKRLSDIDADQMAQSFAVNSVSVALLLKHLLPLLSRDRASVFAALSARVGSISDNRSGGWYAYRASKAALNMLLRTASIELRRTNSSASCIGLHPGTVDTALSQPFQRSVPPDRLFSPENAAARLMAVIAAVGPAESGKCLAWDGSEVPA